MADKPNRAASFLDASGNKVTINPDNVTYLYEWTRGETAINFEKGHAISVKSPIEIVESDLFPGRLYGDN